MGLLDDAIREHLELKRRRGADAGDISREESEALGPVPRGPDGAPDLSGTFVADEPVAEAPDDLPAESDETSVLGTTPAAYEPPPYEPPSEPVHEPPPVAYEPPSEPAYEPPAYEPPSEPVHEPPPVAYEPPPAPAYEPPSEPVHEPPPAAYEPSPSASPPQPDRPWFDAARSHDDEYLEPEPEPEPEPEHTSLLSRFRVGRRKHEPPPAADEPSQSYDPPPPPADYEPASPYEPPPARAPYPSYGHDAPTEHHEPDIVPADDEGEVEDVLEETPDFLEETPEHDRLWFEQRPPRDFDFDD